MKKRDNSCERKMSLFICEIKNVIVNVIEKIIEHPVSLLTYFKRNDNLVSKTRLKVSKGGFK